jgi:C4-type Zn-finger protein
MCRHDGLHSITTQYDRDGEILVYYRQCERCGSRLGDVDRVDYRPDFNPAGNAPYLSSGDDSYLAAA